MRFSFRLVTGQCLTARAERSRRGRQRPQEIAGIIGKRMKLATDGAGMSGEGFKAPLGGRPSPVRLSETGIRATRSRGRFFHDD